MSEELWFQFEHHSKKKNPRVMGETVLTPYYSLLMFLFEEPYSCLPHPSLYLTWCLLLTCFSDNTFNHYFIFEGEHLITISERTTN